MHEVMEQMNGRMRALQREARERADCVALLSQKLGSLHEELARKEEEWSRKRIFLQSRGFDTQHETCARRLNLAEAAKKLASQKLELDELRMEHDKCPAVIAELRKQIKDTTDALETRELCGRLAVAKLEDMLVVTEQKLQKHRQSLCACLAGKEAKMATMRQQLAEADQRHALLSGECWV